MTIKDFIERHFSHFNAGALRDASDAWATHIQRGGKVLLTLGGAMSTAGLGKSIAELIRQDLVHAICTTGANLEEDIFRLIAGKDYVHLRHYRDLTPSDEEALRVARLNRVTDVCIPEDAAIAKLDGLLLPLWKRCAERRKGAQPHRFLYWLITSGHLHEHVQMPIEDSWVWAAARADLPMWCPGWEDSTLGNLFAAHVMRGEVGNYGVVVTGPATLSSLAGWYQGNCLATAPGLIQIGGGISGDFPVSIVPLLRQDLEAQVPLWGYFCQISEATTSYGSYSGAPPNEKITWEKLGVDTPRFVVESDATICFPLMAQYVLDIWRPTQQIDPMDLVIEIEEPPDSTASTNPECDGTSDNPTTADPHSS